MTTEQTLFDIVEEAGPALPYGGTSGWSGSDTSRQRAEEADKDGTTGRNQSITLLALLGAGRSGLTWRDLAHRTGWHHGSASGALSVLHKTGAICRLKETRDRCAIYVRPEYVEGRETSEHRPNVSARILQSVLTEIEEDLRNGRVATAIHRIQATKGYFGCES